MKLDVKGMEALLKMIGVDADVAHRASVWLIEQGCNNEGTLNMRHWYG